jgi:porin
MQVGFLFVLFALLTFAGPLTSRAEERHQGQETPESAKSLSFRQQRSWFPTFDTWHHATTALQEKGFSLSSSAIIDLSRPGIGGIRQRVTARSLFDVIATIDLKQLWNLDGGTVVLDYQAYVGRDASRDVGDLQKFSNLDANERSQIAELWYEQWLFNKRARFKIGKVLADSEFAFVENGAEFMNSSAGHSPTLFVMPVYPDAASSVNFFTYPHEHLYLGFGLYDGAASRGVHTGVHGPETLRFGDVFFVGELGGKWTLGPSQLPGRIGIGGWRHTGTFARFDGGTQRGTAGAYLVLDHALWRENPQQEDDDQGIAMFAQYGYADAAVSEFVDHLSAGFTWTGLFSHRDDDVIGLEATWARLSDEADFKGDYELNIELLYKLQLTSWLSIKPNLQYIINPSGGGPIDDALVGTLRLELTWE